MCRRGVWLRGHGIGNNDGRNESRPNAAIYGGASPWDAPKMVTPVPPKPPEPAKIGKSDLEHPCTPCNQARAESMVARVGDFTQDV